MIVEDGKNYDYSVIMNGGNCNTCGDILLFEDGYDPEMDDTVIQAFCCGKQYVLFIKTVEASVYREKN